MVTTTHALRWEQKILTTLSLCRLVNLMIKPATSFSHTLPYTRLQHAPYKRILSSNMCTYSTQFQIPISDVLFNIKHTMTLYYNTCNRLANSNNAILLFYIEQTVINNNSVVL